MSEFITSFHIDLNVILSQVVTFIATFAVLYFLVIKPLKGVMNERGQKIAGGLRDAKHNAELLAKSTEEYKDIIAQARAEAHTLFQEGKCEADENRAEMVAKAQAEVEQMIAQGKKRLEAEKEKMVEEAKREIVSLVVKATEKLLESHTDEAYTDKAVSSIKKA
jgi:F-type H+-transporting ATPase subunit b